MPDRHDKNLKDDYAAPSSKALDALMRHPKTAVHELDSGREDDPAWYAVVPHKYAMRVAAERDRLRAQNEELTAEIRRALMGHPHSKLWGENGLIAATMRCVDAIGRIEDLVTTDHETKAAFIQRVRGVLGRSASADPLPERRKPMGDSQKTAEEVIRATGRIEPGNEKSKH